MDAKRSYSRFRSSRYRRKPVAGTRRGNRKIISRVKKTQFVRKVKKIVQNQAEVKFYSVRGTKLPYSFQNGNTSLNGNIFILTPPGAGDAITYGAPVIGQGTTDGTRVGNRLRVKKVMFNVACWPEGYNATTNPNPRPLQVRMFFFRTKVNQMTVPASTALNGAGGNFFQDGLTQSGFLGTIVDVNKVLNKDRYIYLGHKSFKLGYSTLQAGANGQDALNMQYGNNDFKYSYTRRMNITKMIPKQFTWDDAGNTTTPYTYCLLQVVPADGSQFALTTIPMKIAYEQYYEYTDI